MRKLVLYVLNKYKFYIITGLCFALLCSAALSSVIISSEQARSADDFVDSIGVVVHLNYRDTVYNKYDEIVKPRLQELGIRHIRDGIALEDISSQQKLIDLAKIGIKSTLIIHFEQQSIGSRAVNFVKSVLESVEAVEGPNEPNEETLGKNFAQMIRNFQTELYFAIKKDPQTANIPVLSPSDVVTKNALKIGQVACDIGNTHHYPGGRWGLPEIGMDRQIFAAKVMCGNKPIIVTESGYNNGTNLQASELGVSEQAAAKYLLRLFLEYFNRGIKSFYTYELIDLKPNSQKDNNGLHYGLLRNDGSPKAAFIALKNIISLLQDFKTSTTNNYTVKSLKYELRGNQKNIHHTLVQKNNGTFYLIVWQEVPSFDRLNKTDIIVPKRSLKLILETSIDRASIYQPVISPSATNLYKNPKQLDLEVSDHPLIIELIPN